MAEMEVGEYVRTNTGLILKYDDENEKTFIDNFLTCPQIMKERIVKHSKQLIELIEVGDILKIKEGNEVCCIGLEKDTTTVSYKDIKASIKKGECELLEILTKEQFLANCYKVGGEDE